MDRPNVDGSQSYTKWKKADPNEHMLSGAI